MMEKLRNEVSNGERKGGRKVRGKERSQGGEKEGSKIGRGKE